MGSSIFTNAGIACLIAAAIGGGLKAFGIEIPLINSWKRQFLLALVGLFFIVVADEAPMIRAFLTSTPTATTIAVTRAPVVTDPTRVAIAPTPTTLPPAPTPTTVPTPAPPPVAAAQPPGAPVVQPMAQVSIFSAEHNAVVNGRPGSRFRVSAELNGFRGRGLALVLLLYERNNVQVPVMYNGNPYLVRQNVRPASDQELRDDHVLFLAYDSIPAWPGYYELFAQAWLLDESGTRLTYSPPTPWVFQR